MSCWGGGALSSLRAEGGDTEAGREESQRSGLSYLSLWWELTSSPHFQSLREKMILQEHGVTQEITAEPGLDASAPNSHTVSQPESVKWDAADSESAAWCSVHSCYTSSAARIFSSDLELCPEKFISNLPVYPEWC